MKKLILVGSLIFMSNLEVLAGGSDETSLKPIVTKSKNSSLCTNVAKLIANDMAIKLEPEHEVHDHAKYYRKIDLDKDHIFDDVVLSCGSSGECLLDANISSGEEVLLNEQFMFYLIRFSSNIYVPTVYVDKSDFPNDASTVDMSAFNARKKRLLNLYKLTSKQAVLVCAF